ncbi:MAG: hypothetical protein AMDU3_IPLC00004G0541 [Thermoplasmatales archaeon I-plasma]|jgi:hypothetical protein|nr:MAG: hypothetical protein AMDU3_IPLC00004G0541 [Thermoplasmatales archaeon I-plasma]
MKDEGQLLSNCFLTWTSILEERELNNKKSEIGRNSETR